MEVYDAELHAVHEALHPLDRLDIPTAQVFICIDNLSAIQTLADDKDNSEPAKMTTQLAHSLKQKGWDIRTAWTPSHIKIMGNEKADEMACFASKVHFSSSFAFAEFCSSAGAYLIFIDSSLFLIDLPARSSELYIKDIWSGNVL